MNLSRRQVVGGVATLFASAVLPSVGPLRGAASSVSATPLKRIHNLAFERAKLAMAYERRSVMVAQGIYGPMSFEGYHLDRLSKINKLLTQLNNRGYSEVNDIVQQVDKRVLSQHRPGYYKTHSATAENNFWQDDVEVESEENDEGHGFFVDSTPYEALLENGFQKGATKNLRFPEPSFI